MNLTPLERLFLFNQYEILKGVDSKNSDHYEELQEIACKGFEVFYGTLTDGLYEPMPESAGKEVMSILDMYRAIYNTQNKAGEPNTHLWAKFRGFDGNDEGKQLGFLNFLMDKQDKWAELAGHDRNSHMPTLQKYRAMLIEWEGSAAKHELTDGDIDRIVTAGDAKG